MKSQLRTLTVISLVTLLGACQLEEDIESGSNALKHIPIGPDAGDLVEEDAGDPVEVDSGTPVVADARVVVPVEEPECPDFPPGESCTIIDPGIASGSTCRGACGPNCPTTCRSLPDIEHCIEWQDENGDWHSKTCEYTGLIECGSHAGCRSHDACYDLCALLDWPADEACKRVCDTTCVNNYGLRWCNSWRRGRGPYDSWITFCPGSTTSVDGPYDTTCF